MTLSEEEIALLDHHADDFYGLWEVDWFFEGAWPNWSRETRIASLSALVGRGLIDIFLGPLMATRPALTPDEARSKLAVPAIWAPPAGPDETGYHVATSPAGTAALRQAHSRSMA